MIQSIKKSKDCGIEYCPLGPSYGDEVSILVLDAKSLPEACKKCIAEVLKIEKPSNTRQDPTLVFKCLRDMHVFTAKIAQKIHCPKCGRDYFFDLKKKSWFSDRELCFDVDEFYAILENISMKQFVLKGSL